MRLECAGSISSDNATEAEIRNAFADDEGRGEFIILSEADQAYIQAANDDADGPWALEYREGGADRHFECTRDVTKAEAEAAFIKYLKGDASWKTDFPWEQWKTKPWWKFW